MKQLRASEVAAWNAAHPTSVMLDVREAWEVATAAIRLPLAEHLHIPMGLIPVRLQDLDASRPILCICHHGARSAQVVAFLERQGFDSVYNLGGGIDAWSLEVDAGVPRY